MGQQPDPTQEEIEFVFQRLLDGMDDKEIQRAIQSDDVFILRTNPRYFRRMRRYFAAAKTVFGKGNHDLVSRKRREHEALLVSGLERMTDWLENLRSLLQAPDPWRDDNGHVGVRSVEAAEPSENHQRRMMGYLDHIRNFLEPPNTLALKCLLRHLRPDDTIVGAYRRVGEVARRYIELHTDLNTGQLGYLREDKEAALLLQINDAKKTFEQLYTTLETDIELRSIIGAFERGPCDVCSNWGGM